MFGILWEIPWWVYVLFIFLMRVGIESLKTRWISLYKLAIFPSIVTFFSIRAVFININFNAFNLICWIVPLLIFFALGWRAIFNLPLQFDKEKKAVLMPGSWTTLAMILVIFCVKFYFNYSLAIDPALAEDTFFELTLHAVQGALSGMFLGRFSAITRRFINS